MYIDKTIKSRKLELLDYFRNRANEFIPAIKEKFAETEADKRARTINELLNKTKDTLIFTLLQSAIKENWSNKEKLEALLMITYCQIVVMIECRNSLKPYEYMDFSRRVGEIWDAFCQLCFYYPLNDIRLFIPPLFSEVKGKLSEEITSYIDRLSISMIEKSDLKNYYNKVWGLVNAGETQLELDLHFEHENLKYVVDFKSGFGSNEKGNTNRLLLIGSIYHNLNEDYKCLLLVRSEENNSYFNILKKSGLWESYCGIAAYQKIHEYSGYNLKNWIDLNIDWTHDFNVETMAHLTSNDLHKYLQW